MSGERRTLQTTPTGRPERRIGHLSRHGRRLANCRAATASGAGSIANVASIAPRSPSPPPSSDGGRTLQAMSYGSGRVAPRAVTKARRPSIQAGAATASASCRFRLTEDNGRRRRHERSTGAIWGYGGADHFAASPVHFFNSIGDRMFRPARARHQPMATARSCHRQASQASCARITGLA